MLTENLLKLTTKVIKTKNLYTFFLLAFSPFYETVANNNITEIDLQSSVNYLSI